MFRIYSIFETLFYYQAEQEIVREMKESICYVIFNPQREDAHTLDKSGTGGLSYQLPDGAQIMV